MRCQEASELMSLRLDDQLEGDARERLEQHLDMCDSCAQLWEIMQRVERLLSRAPIVAPADGFTARVMARLPERRLPNSHLGLAILVLAFGALVTSVLFIGSLVVTAILEGQSWLEFGRLIRGLIDASWFVEQVRSLFSGLWLTGRVVSRAIPLVVVWLMGLLGLMLLLVWGAIVGRIRLAQTTMSAE